MSSRPYEPPKEGRSRFLATQDRSDAAVSYDPCRVIRVVINPRTMPPDAAGLVEDGLELLGNATGLQFEVEGTTDEPSTNPRPSFQPMRYGDRWAPILISWSDPEESPELGDAAGVAGSEYVEARGRYVYVSGHLVLDGPDLAKILAVDAGDSRVFVSDVILHELGHLVGLDHVDDENELMFPEGRGERHGFGPGDRRGLYELGGGRCLESI